MLMGFAELAASGRTGLVDSGMGAMLQMNANTFLLFLPIPSSQPQLKTLGPWEMSLVCWKLVSSDASDWESSKNWKCGLYLYAELLWGLVKNRTDSVSLLIGWGDIWQSGPCISTHTVCSVCVNEPSWWVTSGWFCKNSELGLLTFCRTQRMLNHMKMR